MTRVRPASIAALLSGLAILLLAAGLRFYRIDYQSYWNDEGNTRVLVGRDTATLLRNTAADIHPPGYYLALKVWRALVGESELALRGFSALAGVVLVALVYRLGRGLAGARAAAAAAALAAVNPFLIYYSQEARMYALLAAVSAGSFFLFERLWKKGLGDWRLASGYCLVTAAGLYTHYAFGFVVIAQNLIALLRPAGLGRVQTKSSLQSRVIRWLSVQAAVLLLYLPWLPNAYRQLTGWPAAREFHPLWQSFLDLFRYLAFGRTLPTAEALWGLAAVAGLALLGLWRSAGSSGPMSRPAPQPSAAYLSLLVWLLVPAGLTLAFGLLTEAFSKFLLVAVPALCLLLGGAVGALTEGGSRLTPPRWLAAGMAGALGLVVVSVTALSLNNLYFNPAYFRDDYRGLARHLAGLQRPGDAVITNAPNQAEAFDYYLRSDLPGHPPLFPLPDTRPLDPARTTAQLAEIAARHERVFVLYWGDQQADPERVIETWLNANTFKAGDQWFGQVRLATYAAARPASEPAVLAGARFGDHITLAGYTLRADALGPGDILQMTFFWRADAALAERYKVFLHLYAAVEAPPLAQQDGEPGGGLALTSTWTPGQTVVDNHGLLIPPDLEPGEYRLMAGLYSLTDGARLPVALGDTIVGDRLDLGPVIVANRAP
mgnify:CR=1 FL=1